MSKARHARPRRSTRRVARTITIAGLGAGITAAGAGAAFATDYTVKAGDTLSEIAQANGADWHQLAKINNLKDPDLILIGQTLSLDGANKAAAPAPRKVSAKKAETKKTHKAETKKVRKAERKVRDSRSKDRSTSSGKANPSGWNESPSATHVTVTDIRESLCFFADFIRRSAAGGKSSYPSVRRSMSVVNESDSTLMKGAFTNPATLRAWEMSASWLST